MYAEQHLNDVNCGLHKATLCVHKP